MPRIGRGFPPQWNEPNLGGQERSLGPDPPQVVLPLPTLRMQTVTVWRAATSDRVVRPRRGTGYTLNPPVLISPPGPPTQQQETVSVTCVAVRHRVTRSRYGPRQSLLKLVAGTPVVVLAPPIAVSLTSVDVRVAAVRRAARSFLRLPSTLQVFSGPLVNLARIRPRPTTKYVHPPAVIFPAVEASPITVTLAAERTRLAPGRAPKSRLSAPTVLLPTAVWQRMQTVRIASAVSARLAVSRRFPPQWYEAGFTTNWGGVNERGLGADPPQVVLPLPTLQMQTVSVRCIAVRTRVESQRRAPHSRLSAPAVVLTVVPPLAPPVLVSLQAANLRTQYWRRFVLHIFFGPAVVNPPAPPTQQQQTLTVQDVALPTRAAVQRRAPHSRLSKPAALQTFSGPNVTLAAIRTRTEQSRHAPHSRLGVPGVTAPPPNLRQQTLVVVLAVQPRLGLLRRAPHPKLSAPTKVLPLPTLREQTIKATLVAVRTRTEAGRRGTHYALYKPAALAPTETVPSVTSVAVAARLQRVRVARYTLRPPGLSVPLGRVAATLAAAKTRADQIRRGPHSKIQPPTAVLSLPTQQMQTVRVWTAWKTRVDLARRAPRSVLSQPTSVRPPPTEQQQQLTVINVAVPGRLGLLPRAPHARLSPPTAVQPITNLDLKAREPLSAWTTGAMISGWDGTEPMADIQVGKPQ